MARLEFEIAGNNSGLAAAANQSIGILESLQNVADGLKIDLFKSTTVDGINNIGAALTRVTGNIRDYINTAVKGSQAWQDQTAATALDQLSTKLLAITGNAQLFGTTVKTQQQEITAYQAAISRLLSAGLDPMDTRIQSLKTNIDSLTASITAQNAAAARSKFNSQFQDTGSLITDAQRKVDRLGAALRAATDERGIIQYRVRLTEAERELERLTSLGVRAAQSTQAIGASGQRLAGSFNQVGIEFGRVIQDLPYAANNFGAVGNNITRIVEVLPGYLAQTRAAIVANGGIATSANVAKTALAGLFTGFGGISLAISAAVAGFVIYQQVQQANARAAAAHTDALQKQKKALDDYIGTLGALAKATSDAASSYGTEIAKLDQLFSAIQNNSKARFENGTAIQELQKLYPDVFGSLKENEFLTLKAADAYGKLKDGIISAAIAASATKLAGKAIDDQVSNTVALAGAQDRVTLSQQKYNALLDHYNELISGTDKSFSTNVAREGLIKNALLDLKDAGASLEAAKTSVMDYRAEIFKAQQAVDNYNKVATDAFAKNKQPQKSGILFNLEAELKRLQDIRPTIKAQVDLDLNTKQIKKVQDQIDKLGGAKGSKRGPVDTSAQNQLSLSEQLRNISQRSASASAPDLANSYQEQKDKIEATYADLFNDLNAVEQKITLNTKINAQQRAADVAKVGELRKTLEENQLTAIQNLNIKDAQDTANEVQRIRDASSVKTTVTRQKELAEIDARYNAEIVKAKDNDAVLTQIAESRAADIKAVNDKYAALSTDLYSKIGVIEDTALAASKSKEDDQTQKIKNEWEKRRKEAAKYYDQLRALQDTNVDPFGVLPGGVASGISNLIGTPSIDKAQKQTNDLIDKGQSKEIATNLTKELTQGLTRGVKSFADNFYNTLTSINQQADQSFGAIFSTLSTELNKSLNNIFLNVVSTGLEKALKKGIEDGASGLGAKLTGALAVAGLAGGLISGITPKTSAVGQTTGGAISGAAGGALAGSVIPGLGTVAGGVIGGVIGGIGGLFGSKKARKEAEKLQQQQLDEAKKQTELLRQQALAYTSSIIGKQTTNGIITGVDINAFGELTAKVSGKDLQFVLDRNAQSR